MKLYAPSTIKEIKNQYNFRLSKSLGQNFLTDKHIIDRIIEGSRIGPEDLVIEIGPGIGVLTAEAAENAKRVVAVEIDNGLIPILEDTLKEYDNITILNQDVLKTDFSTIVSAYKTEGKTKRRMECHRRRAEEKERKFPKQHRKRADLWYNAKGHGAEESCPVPGRNKRKQYG